MSIFIVLILPDIKFNFQIVSNKSRTSPIVVALSLAAVTYPDLESGALKSADIFAIQPALSYICQPCP